MTRWATDPLRHVRIASPCPADWDAMYGDERVRLCSKCELNVYNLSAMTRREAERLIVNREGRLCVRFYRRSDGTILTEDCPVGLRAIKRKVTRAAVACFSFVFGAGAGNMAYLLGGRGTTRPTHSMGKPMSRIDRIEPAAAGMLVPLTGVAEPVTVVGEMVPPPPIKIKKHARKR
jgi:hypothetical protein